MADQSLFALGVGGFILLHASQVQPKNTSSVIIANLLSIAVGTIVFWAVGYAFALGDGTNFNSNFFFSYTRFFLIDATEEQYGSFGKEVLYLMLVLVLSNSGFVSRMRYWIYPLLTLFVSGIIYPFALHWIKHNEGWLKAGVDINLDNEVENISYTDEGGAAWIHIFGGSVSVIGTILLAPRKDRQGKKFPPVGGNLTPLMLVGYFMSVIGMLSKQTVGSRTITNSMLAAQGSAFVAFSLKRTGVFGDRSSTKALINGSLAGLVAISAAPGGYVAYKAFVIGVVGGVTYTCWSALLQRCHIDDPTDSAAVHLGVGFWAAIASPIFQDSTGIASRGADEQTLKTFGWHLLAAVAVFVWSGLTVFVTLIFFVCTRAIKYSGREPAELGLDALEHKEPAYPDREQYTPDKTDQILDDLFIKDTATAAYGYDNRGTTSRESGTYDNRESRRTGEDFSKY